MLFPPAARFYPTHIRSTGIGAAMAFGRIGNMLSPAAAGFMLGAGLQPASVFYAMAAPMVLSCVALVAFDRLTASGSIRRSAGLKPRVSRGRWTCPIDSVRTALPLSHPGCLVCTPSRAADDVDSLARDVDRLTSLRQVKDLQRSYAQYEQFGLWDEMASLFTSSASSFAARKRLAVARCTQPSRLADVVLAVVRGLAPGALHTEMIDEPLVNLSADGPGGKGAGG